MTEPAAPNSELQLLCCIRYDDSTLLEIMDVVRPDDFVDEHRRLVYEIILKLHKEGAPLDLRTIIAEASKSGKDVTVTAISMDEQATLDFRPAYHAAEVVEASNLRRLIKISGDASRAAMSRKPSSGVSGRLIDEALAVRGRERYKPARTPEEAALAAAREIEDHAKMVKAGRTCSHNTWMAHVDNLLGGLNVGEYSVVAAAQSIGKSSWMLNVAKNNAVRQTPILFLTIEMSERALRGKLFQTFPGSTLTANKIIRGELSEEQVAEMHRYSETISTWPFIIEEGAQTLSSVRAAIIRARLHIPSLRLVMIDGLYVMTSDRDQKTDNRYQEVSTISRGLKSMCSMKDLACHIMVSHQFAKTQEARGTKRELDRGSGAKPVMGDLRDSGTIAQDADQIIFLHRDRVDGEGKQPDRVPTELIVAKNRNHRIGSQIIYFEPATQRFSE